MISGLYIDDVSCGNLHCCALTLAHSLVCWGDNRYGQSDTSQLGSDFGDVLDFSTGYFSTCALSMTRKVTCFGLDIWGQLGGGSFDIPPEFTETGVRISDSGSAAAHFCVYEELINGLKLQCMLSASLRMPSMSLCQWIVVVWTCLLLLSLLQVGVQAGLASSVMATRPIAEMAVICLTLI